MDRAGFDHCLDLRAQRVALRLLLVTGYSARRSRFDADESGNVTLAARWEALGPTGRPLGPARESTITEPGSGKDAPAVATTMSRAVAALAARIAAGLR